MTDHILHLLDELNSFELNVNSYFDDTGYIEFVENLVDGKVKALALSLDRLRMTAEASEVRGLTWDRSGIIPVLEILRGSIIPSIRATLQAPLRLDVHNNLFAYKGAIEWNHLRFRTVGEVRIAEALDAVGVLFLPNCRARLGEKDDRENREPDFLICSRGMWGILEIDGRSHTPSRTVDDHDRDRLFKLHGIRVVEHFDDAECFENAKQVVAKFLRILDASA
jgi:hypothetical protein